jgi:hypothetical protein
LGSISEIVEEEGGEGEQEEPTKKTREDRFFRKSPSESPQHFQKSASSEIIHHQPQSAPEADASSVDRMLKEYDRQYGKIPEGFEERKGIVALLIIIIMMMMLSLD